jgi:hypothetical protein
MRFSEGEKHLEELAAQREFVHRLLARSKEQTIDVDAMTQSVWGEDTSSLLSITPITRKTRTRSPSSEVQDIEIPAAPKPHPRPIKVSVKQKGFQRLVKLLVLFGNGIFGHLCVEA